MIGNKTLLALITARGGSKGIPQKNIIDLGGKPLLTWTIEAANGSPYIDRLILSSDDEAIISTARKYNCEVPFVRPGNLALDTTSSMDVIMHALDSLETRYDYILLLQPTSPFRTSQHINQAVEFLIQSDADSIVSVSPAQSPELMFNLSEDGSLNPFIESSQLTRRQDAKSVFAYNGAIYLSSVPYLRKVRNYKTPETKGLVLSNFIDVDVDEPDDLAYARYLVQQKLLTKN